jgi:hypothetical protein
MRGDSNKSVSTKDRETSEYTEFRPMDRVRKAAYSVADEAPRFSEFRHSDVLDVRASDMEQVGTGASSHMTASLYDDDEDEQLPQDSLSARSLRAGTMTKADDFMSLSPKPSIARSNRARSQEEGKSQRQLVVRSPEKTKVKRPRSQRAQKDLSRLALAPSAHQQEFNAWHLTSNSSIPVSSGQGSARQMSLKALAQGTSEGNSPFHLRASVMADRSSMVTSDDRSVDMEEGELRVFENPLSAERTRSVMSVNISDRSKIISLGREQMRSAEMTGDAPYAGRRDRPRSMDISPVTFDTPESRSSEANTVHTEHMQNSSSSAPVAEEGFKAIYYTRWVLLVVSRFLLGGNVYPLGPTYIRRLLELSLLVLSLADMALGSIICFEYYCVSADTTSCQNHTDLFLILGIWPLALIITPLMGVFAIMLGPSGTLTRIYAMWNRLAVVNNIIIISVFLQYYTFFNDLPITTYPPIMYMCSRALQCLMVDQYIAHIERLRYTRGWDGLHTSLFKTQDHKTVIT